MSQVASQAALERQIRPIYDALDSNSNKTAILACNKLLKKYPKLDLVKALKALAIVRTNKIEEALPICDEVLAAKPTDLETLSAMMHVLRTLGRFQDMVAMFDEAFRRKPEEELGAQDFFANVRTGNWKAAQQIATKMHKAFKSSEKYLYWSIMSAVLQANDASTPPAMSPILHKLAHRLVSSSQLPSTLSADRLYLHLAILRENGLLEEAHALLDSEEGRAIVRTSLVVDELRREVVRERGRWSEEYERARARVVDEGNRNWLEFLALLDAAFADVSAKEAPSEETKTASAELVAKTRTLLKGLADADGTRERGPLLALLELEARARKYGVGAATEDSEGLLALLRLYLERFGDKACCFEDLRPYVGLEGDEPAQWTAHLDALEQSHDTPTALVRTINALKLRRYILAPAELTAPAETERALGYLRTYSAALALGRGLPATELQPADDLALLGAQALVGLWASTGDVAWLYNAASVLEYAVQRSKHSYLVRLHLIRIYRLLAAPALMWTHYRAMNVKQVQNDTLSHFVLAQASLFSLASSGDITFTQECVEASAIYSANSTETAEFIVRAFNQEKYSQVADFISFEDRLDNSLQRDLVKVEHVRMRLTHEIAAVAEIVDTEVIELKFIFDRQHHDNRDFAVLPNYQPHGEKSFNEQTLLVGSNPGLGWLTSMLRVYIRVFQLATDYDDTVEQQLLIGDRPKLGSSPELKRPLAERLREGKEEELAELTDVERALFDFAMALADWLAPYHDYARPPPAAVLAEATRQAELRAGKKAAPAGKSEVKAEGDGEAVASGSGQGNGSANGNANGHGNGQKRPEEPPAVKDAPEIISQFFDDMSARFKAATSGDKPSAYTDALHVATVTREAVILFAIATMRFKSPAVVKTNKFGALTQMFKALRAKAVGALREMAEALVKIGDAEGTIERRRAFVDACKPIQVIPEFQHDFIVDVSKKVTDARKRVIEGVGKGALKLLQQLP